ncbi:MULTISPECIES: glycosyltransferase family 2 protein [Haloarcula]|uniref:glycosyltransferase family 2 protein n=1 Tax=Haloarcula TaxID=2237 RepID=UPI0023EADDBB|nr:glycosyltransferase family 2 protein [Halomicroarcula sp. XH51]
METDTESPLVSVVIPTYGRPEFLIDAVQSVVDQTYPEVELVVVDDHSPDPVEPSLADIPFDELARAEVVRHEENRGGNAARRTGIERSSGEFVAFLDDDDHWDPTLVERVVSVFQAAGPDVGVVMAGTRIVDEDGDEIGRVVPDAEGDVTEGILRGTVRAGSFSRFTVRRSVVDATGLPDERLPSWQDLEWHIRLSARCEYASLRDAVVTRRVTSHDQITDDFEAKRDVSYPLLLEKHRPLAAEFGRGTERRFVATLTLTLGFSALRNGYYATAVRTFGRAIRYDPLAPKAYLYLLLALGGPLTYKPAKGLRRKLKASMG